MSASETCVKQLRLYYKLMSKETNSNLVDDYEDSGSYINEETLEIFSQLEEPLPFSIKDFTPEPFIPTL